MPGVVIKQIFAVVALNDNGEEGVIAIKGAQGWIPLITSDPAGVDVIWKKALALEPPKHIRLVRMASRKLMDEHKP